MYTTAEIAALDLVIASGLFTADTARRDDYTVIDVGADVVCVVEQAGDTVEADRLSGYGAQGMRTQQHEIAVILLTRIGDGLGGDGAAIAASKTTAETLSDYLANYERLNGAAYVQRAQVARISRPEPVRRAQTAAGAATHIQQRITVRVITSRAWQPTELSH
jgi:hypothetical protein